MKKILRFAPAISLYTGFGIARAQAACDPTFGIFGGLDCMPGNPGLTLPQAIQTTVNTLLFIVGVTAVIALIIAGIRYITSGGNPQSVTAAKNSILYAVIGIVVAVLAYAIVEFVVRQFT